jgi:hypothetical protein
MLIETLQTIAGWLTDATTGVNAIRTSVPRYGGDDAPPSVTVVQSFRDGDAAREQAKQTGLPVLEVLVGQEMMQESSVAVRPFPADGEVSFGLRYVAAKTTDTALALRQGALTLRCATRAIAARAVGGTTVNEVQIITVSGFRMMEVFASDGDTVVTMSLMGTARVRDLWTHPT